MTTSAEQLLALVRPYWRTDDSYAVRGERSPGTGQLHTRWEEARALDPRWKAALAALGEALPDYSIRDITTPRDAGFRCASIPPAEQQKPSLRWGIGGCLSIIAPFYAVYGVRYLYRRKRLIRIELHFDPLLPNMRPAAEATAKQLETHFGVSRLPLELANTRIPLYVDAEEPPRTTLFHALFTSQPESLRRADS
ncbi:hypothetical protein P2318_13235 [Myxococcaceae bacterium GXIMD 01537]